MPFRSAKGAGWKCLAVLSTLLTASAGVAEAAAQLVVPPFSESLNLSSVERLYKSAAYKVEVRRSGTSDAYSQCFVFETRNDYVYYDFYDSNPANRPNVLRSSSQTGYPKCDLQTASFTQFFFAESAVDVRVTLLQSGAVANSVTIRPLRHTIAATISPDKKVITFSLPSALKVSVEVNDRLNPLFLFTAAPDVPDKTATYYYGPGIHRIAGSGTLNVKSNQRVYIDAGAIVEGRFLLDEGSTNIKIRGRGIICNGEWPHSYSNAYNDLWPKATIRAASTDNLLIEGLTLVHSTGWQIAIEDYSGTGNGTHDNQYLNVNTVSWNTNTDAFWITGNNNRVDNGFVFNNDDCLVTKGGAGTTVSNLVHWNSGAGHLLLLYANSSSAATIRNLTLDTIDVIGVEGTPEVILGNSPIAKPVSNIVVRNLRIEERRRPGNSSNNTYNDGVFLRIGTSQQNATLTGLTFENVTLDQKLSDEGYLLGSSSSLYKDITFKNLVMGGQLILSRAASNISFNSDVTNVQFLPPDSSPTDLASWRQTNFGTTANTGIAADSADPDFDGTPNIIEFATKNSPKGFNTKPSSQAGITAGRRLTFTFAMLPLPATVTYRVESAQLLPGFWTAIATLPAGSTTWTLRPGVTAVGQTVGSDTIMTVTDNVTPADFDTRFLRLSILP